MKTNFYLLLLLGTDTVNSLRSPASANSLFSFRPTGGLISRAGVIPISYTQDAVGAIARNVRDLAIALTVMARVGYDPQDNTTALIPPSSSGVDYSRDISSGSLRGVRFGLIRQEIDTYLQMPTDGGDRPSTLSELYRSGKFLVIPTTSTRLSGLPSAMLHTRH
jgi:Asp-tRNA(Asn)/Glu-tRNA(Gln) amidotransferase A subunit family amidase